MRRLLVVTTARVEGARLREEVRRHAGDEGAEVRIVAPATDISPLKWLYTDVDDARAEAEEVAREASEAVASEAVVEAEVGDTDPVQAIEDALRTFPADELILVTREGDEARWLEKDAAEEALARFDLPVTHLAVGGG